jgi:PqqD family protein of HPr-rel-A system
MNQSTPLSHPRLARLAVNSEGFVFDPQTGESFTVNASGGLIIRSLSQSVSDDAAIDALVETFDITRQEAQGDLRDFIQQLRLFRLV